MHYPLRSKEARTPLVHHWKYIHVLLLLEEKIRGKIEGWKANFKSEQEKTNI